jgi:hypothetical protein
LQDFLLGRPSARREEAQGHSTLIFASSKRKSWKVNKALEGNAWVRKITLDESFTTDHLSQFVELWVKLQGVHLNEEVADDISWKLTANGQ